jgi:uncharacterized protein
MTHVKAARGLVLALLALLLIPAAAFAQPKFPALTGRVVDNANLLSPQVEQQLEQKLAGLEQSTGRQLVVATLPDLQGYEIEEYGYQLGRAWAIGSKERNDGALLLVAPSERKVRIEVGYGLEGVLTDALSSVIIQTAILPQFRQGNFEQGVVAGTDELVKQLSLPDDQARANVAKVAQREEARSSGGGGIHTVIVVLVIFWVLAGMLRGLGGRRRRRSGLWWLLPVVLSSGGGSRGGGWGGGGGFGGGGFGGGGGSFGGGGSSGSW